MVEKAIGLDAIYMFLIVLQFLTPKDCPTYHGLVWAIQSAF